MLHLIKPSHLIKLNTRSFWTTGSGTSIGYIETIANFGYLISTPYVSFRETSSNLSSSSPILISISYLPTEQTNNIKNYMINRTPVQIRIKQDLIGSPFKGDVCEARYAYEITPLYDEIVNIKEQK
jgi:hypothetical protein